MGSGHFSTRYKPKTKIQLKLEKLRANTGKARQWPVFNVIVSLQTDKTELILSNSTVHKLQLVEIVTAVEQQ